MANKIPEAPPPLEITSSTMAGGQDASKFPPLVPEASYFAGVNVDVSRGFPTPRFGFVKQTLSFPTGGITIPVSNTFISYKEIFHSGRFQAFIPYNVSNDYYWITVINGIIFLVNQDTWVVSILPIQGGGNLNENTPRLNWSAANKYVVIFDFPNFPVVFDGVTVERSSAYTDGIPTSVGGIYNQNRLFIYNAGNSYTAGDPTGSLAAPDAPVTFQEILTGGSPVFGEVFDLPTARVEKITAMMNLQLIDTSTGVGPLLIGTKNAIYSVQSQTPRIVIDGAGNQIPGWQTNGFASAYVLNTGIAGALSWVNVNSDVFFMAPNGSIRTANMSRNEQGKWARTPISKEVSNWIGEPDENLTEFAVAGYFKNKIFFSVNPFRASAYTNERQEIFDVAHGGMVVLSLDNLATIDKDALPAWDGLWTGVRPMSMGINRDRFFIISKDDEFTNEIYEMDHHITYDRDGDALRPVEATLYTREYDFQSPFQDKDILTFEPELETVKGDLHVEVSYKPAQIERYIKWRSFDKCAPWRFCDIPTSDIINGLAPHSYFAINLGSPEDGGTCGEPSGVMNSVFRSVQFKLKLSAIYWELKGFRARAGIRSQDDRIYGICDDLTCKQVPKECNNDWYIPPFRGCFTFNT